MLEWYYAAVVSVQNHFWVGAGCVVSPFQERVVQGKLPFLFIFTLKYLASASTSPK